MAKAQLEKNCRFFLKSLHMNSYGGAIQKSVGPFSPGLNVIYGPNESGKSTTASFIGGVMFGWETARGRKNSYKPMSGERSGSLVFERVGDPSSLVSMARGRNADGIICSEPNEILSDVDRGIFKSAFSFSSDELRDLDSSDVMAKRLLSAGVGASVSPADASSDLDRKLSSCMSKSASHPDSIPNLQKRLEECREQLSQARNRSERAMSDRNELQDVERSIPTLKVRLEEGNRQVEELSLCKAELEKLEEDYEYCKRFQKPPEIARGENLRTQGSHAREKAKGRTPSDQGFSSRENDKTILKASLGVFLACSAGGLVLLALAFARSNMMFALLGAASFLLAACAGMATVIFKSNGAKDASVGESYRSGQESRWEAEQDELDRAETEARIAFAENRMRVIEQRREAIYASMGLEDDNSAIQIHELMRSSMARREECQRMLDQANLRCGELRQRIDALVGSDDVETLRLAEQEILQRLRKSKDEYAKLLVARRLMDSTLDSWGSNSQRRVYQQASRLFSLMTNGEWTKVSQTQEGDLVVFDKRGESRSPVLLSLSTCQQLYLALRIALLLTAGNVGKSIPIIADDILVHFDDERRYGAACALAELAQKRQVVFFTCHLDIVELVRKAYASVNIIRL